MDYWQRMTKSFGDYAYILSMDDTCSYLYIEDISFGRSSEQNNKDKPRKAMDYWQRMSKSFGDYAYILSMNDTCSYLYIQPDTKTPIQIY